MTERTSEDSFFNELERAAKGLSVVTDKASTDALRRLFGELRDAGDAGPEDGDGDIASKDGGRVN